MISLDSLPLVDYAPMNDVHYEEVVLLNSVTELLQSPSDNTAEITSLLDEILAHTQEHFANEEQLMQTCNFPAYDMHKAEHTRVLSQLQTYVDQWKETHDNTVLLDYFRVEIPSWLDQHINTMDTITARFICMHQGGC